MGTGCRITHRYEIAKGVESLLDYVGSRGFFSDIPETPETTGRPWDYAITLDYGASPRRVLKGTLEKHGLPEDFREFSQIIRDFISVYGDGEILSRAHPAEKIMYCSVQFSPGGKVYYYISLDPSIREGDWVVVPAGRENRESLVQVVEIGYYSPEEVPLPLEKTKYILRRCTEDVPAE